MPEEETERMPPDLFRSRALVDGAISFKPVFGPLIITFANNVRNPSVGLRRKQDSSIRVK